MSNKFDYASIFISIASFCDPDLIPTLKHAVSLAHKPDRLFFSVIDQSEKDIERECTSIAPHLRYLHISPHQSNGACWARSVAMSNFRGEQYFFQIDSHTRFDQGWDSLLISNIEDDSIRYDNKNLILSTRPFGFVKNADRVILNRHTLNTLVLRPISHNVTIENPHIPFSIDEIKTRSSIRGIQLSAGCFFTRGYFVESVPYDPYMYFIGEEQSLSVRAITKGWTIIHPNHMHIYHFYKKRTSLEPPLHWDEKFENTRNTSMSWHASKNYADHRLYQLMNGRLGGAYGLGRQRSIRAYLKATNCVVDGKIPDTG